ncbi:precorrin-6A synthase (deacetylating) [Streptomyces sp. HNM0574]|uniref:precorrin-6A synthase (deacetylating) n=1 Tax=Streptomyces sp. HNM0574 TaxID=2714954 RepID=UPI00146B542A|nr:precorrin-6A synthase (deacetylating) [Streptomyces sp. HNM0574]NLU67836.1 precorrin-6A synthase (deacetylating) [Streptomyces sp. HNM0574]
MAPERHVLVVGIGAGDPEHLTFAAVHAMRRADVFFVIEKGEAKAGLTRLRRDVLDAHVPGPFRIVEADDPWRDRTRREAGAYASAVHGWRGRRADLFERLIREELAPGECGAFLVWGDPGLYDSTLGVLEEVTARGTVAFGYEVVPGVSSVSALAARHRIPLNRVGRPVHITPGRQLADRLPEFLGGESDVVVMLDTTEALPQLAERAGAALWIYWGAYLGTPDELLVAGPLPEVAARIDALRKRARAEHGWIMDTYLLRFTGRPSGTD